MAPEKIAEGGLELSIALSTSDSKFPKKFSVFSLDVSLHKLPSNLWTGLAIKVPTVSGVQESLQAMPLVFPKKTKKQVTDFMKCRRCMEIPFYLQMSSLVIL